MQFSFDWFNLNIIQVYLSAPLTLGLPLLLSQTKQTVEAALGMPLERAFVSFETKSLASASIAQVTLIILKDCPGVLVPSAKASQCPSECMLYNGPWIDLRLYDVPLPPSGAPGCCPDPGSPGIPRGGVCRGQGAASARGRAHHVGLCPASFHGQPDLQVRFNPPPIQFEF